MKRQIKVDTTLGYVERDQKDDEWDYYGKKYTIKFSGKGINEYNVGHVMFTETGKELFPISGSRSSEDYRNIIIENLRGDGFIVEKLDIE